jgi:hypothetical protein
MRKAGATHKMVSVFRLIFFDIYLLIFIFLILSPISCLLLFSLIKQLQVFAIPLLFHLLLGNEFQ